ncbi:pentapeptide repeat-containing protein [Trebonia sp.]|uniref:pentapeptide repeat-containing protein n=1 Tax=Trebonia sp. TaxID=2767075 RepID=UPI00262A64AC|nr:pentapeptide repeat-containing protein [Trebonia sp.]
MSPEVTAAIIAAGVSFLTLIGTLAAQYFGRRATKRDTKEAFEEQRKQLDKTLTAQSDQLDRTLTEQRTRTLNERFATAAEQLGSDKATVRLAGVYAMAGLADDWVENRQTCVDVLCAYLRMPYEPDPGEDASEPQRLAFRAIRQARHTVIRVIAAHLQKRARVSWKGLDFDFTSVVFDGGDFSFAQFSGGEVDFSGAQFSSGTVDFSYAQFSGSQVYFSGVHFSGGNVNFAFTEFSDGVVYFGDAQFSGAEVYFGSAEFSGGEVYFRSAEFSGGKVSFYGALFPGGGVYFFGAQFSGGMVNFNGAQFSGARVDFDNAQFSGGTIDFSDAGDWSVPPAFPWTRTPPPGVKLPKGRSI